MIQFTGEELALISIALEEYQNTLANNEQHDPELDALIEKVDNDDDVARFALDYSQYEMIVASELHDRYIDFDELPGDIDESMNIIRTGYDAGTAFEDVANAIFKIVEPDRWFIEVGR